MDLAVLRVLLVLAAQVALAVSAALVVRRAGWLAALLGASGFLVLPWFAGTVAARGASALIGGIGLLRVIDLVRVGGPWPAQQRVLHVMSLVDTRTLRRAPRDLEVRAFARLFVWAALAFAGAWIAASSAPLDARLPLSAARWGGGVLLVYSAIEAGYAFYEGLYRALGFITPRLHVLPIASLSVAELWGLRWARPISAWLRETCFQPMARRGRPRLGLFFGFVASALGHAYPVLVATDASLAALMFGFFVVQAAFVILERVLGAARWPRPLRRAWTVTLMLASSPMFVEPALAVLGIGDR